MVKKADMDHIRKLQYGAGKPSGANEEWGVPVDPSCDKKHWPCTTVSEVMI